MKLSKGAVEAVKVSGHSGYGVRGKDIVCAAVSTALVGALNCLDDPSINYRIEVERGLGDITVLRSPSDHDRVVLEVMVRELGYLAETYPEFIRYQEEERK